MFKVHHKSTLKIPSVLLSRSHWHRFCSWRFPGPNFVLSNFSMKLFIRALILCLSLSQGKCTEETMQDNVIPPSPLPEESSYSDWGIGTIRDGIDAVNGYFDFVSELLGGKNGVCQYRCRYGKHFGCYFFHIQSLTHCYFVLTVVVSLHKAMFSCFV